jgi:putative redox protein
MPGQITVNLNQQSPTVSLATIRQHTLLVDRPAAKEGTDEGPMGGELLLAGLGGCFMSNLLAAVRARQAPVSNIQATVTGTLVEAPTRFSAIELKLPSGVVWWPRR